MATHQLQQVAFHLNQWKHWSLTLAICLTVLAHMGYPGAAAAEDEKATPGALYEKATCLQETGALKEARTTLQTLIEHPECSESLRIEAELRIGHTFWQQGEYAQAQEVYRRIADDTSIPFHWRTIAMNRMAQSSALGEDDLTYFEQYNAVLEAAEDTGLPAGVERHLSALAEEQMRSNQRLKEGLPAWSMERTRTALPSRPKPGFTLHVAPHGDDQAAGSETAPLATLVGARDKIREHRRNEDLPEGGVLVRIHAGDYALHAGFELTAEDAGEPGSPIVYAAHSDETPRFTGGEAIEDFVPVDDPAVLDRLPAASREQVMQADLHTQGITDLGTLAMRGFGQPPQPTPEVYFNGEALQPARWPNEGFVYVDEIIEQTDDNAVFTFENDRPTTWAEPEKAWMFGYWYHHWADETLPVADIDQATKQLTTDGLPTYGVRSGQHYYYFNVLEELDQPGEWYLDRDAGVLYIYPPSDIEEANVSFSVLEDPMVTMDHASHVWLEKLHFDVSRGHGIVIESGSHNMVAGCTLSRLAQDGVIIQDGKNHGVVGCELFSLGRGGFDVSAGERETLERGNVFIENNEVRDFSRLDRTYTPAVLMRGVGNRIAHNLFHDAPHHAIRLDGNDHTVEFNEIHSVVYESDDQAGLDMWFNPTYRGNVIRYNFWHHIGSGLARHGQSGIRLDDAISGVRVYGNVFLRASGGVFGAVQIHGGKENIIDGNLFIDCTSVFSFSPWGEARWQNFLEDNRGEFVPGVDINEPPYAKRYPELADLESNPDVNYIWRNVALDCDNFLLRDPGNQVLADNWVGSLETEFTDSDNRELALPVDAPIYALTGMSPIPFAHIGLHNDTYRARWPVDHEVSENYMALQPDE